MGNGRRGEALRAHSAAVEMSENGQELVIVNSTAIVKKVVECVQGVGSFHEYHHLG